jgi:NAD-dependent SIR2 family protein deacetylase
VTEDETARTAESLRGLADLLANGRVVALTGAGVSTSSGIPDYRDENGAWKRPQPVDYRDFVARAGTRRRYWGRSVLGFAHMASVRPNASHFALEALERLELVSLVLTQNVDGLHQSAGSRRVLDLHGRLDRVVCLACGRLHSRSDLQAALLQANPGWLDQVALAAPDGDADLEVADYTAFQVVDCAECGGLLKPDVVFFGEAVPKTRVDQAMAAIDAARAVLVAGTSLMTFSGFRFVKRARERGIPVLVVNRGRTRADDFATEKVSADAGQTLSALLSLLGPSGAGS